MKNSQYFNLYKVYGSEITLRYFCTTFQEKIANKTRKPPLFLNLKIMCKFTKLLVLLQIDDFL